MTKLKDYIRTFWDIFEYDVWGNAKEGWSMNTRYNITRGKRLHIKKELHNAGTDREFESACPSDKQLRELFGIPEETEIYIFGDDRLIFVERKVDRYPYGEMICVSHDSLSPIRKRV